MKPESIMIKKDGSTVLLDFGIARHLGATSITSTGFQPGTYIWAAPEQIQGKKDMMCPRNSKNHRQTNRNTDIVICLL